MHSLGHAGTSQLLPVQCDEQTQWPAMRMPCEEQSTLMSIIPCSFGSGNARAGRAAARSSGITVGGSHSLVIPNIFASVSDSRTTSTPYLKSGACGLRLWVGLLVFGGMLPNNNKHASYCELKKRADTRPSLEPSPVPPIYLCG